MHTFVPTKQHISIALGALTLLIAAAIVATNQVKTLSSEQPFRDAGGEVLNAQVDVNSQEGIHPDVTVNGVKVPEGTTHIPVGSGQATVNVSGDGVNFENQSTSDGSVNISVSSSSSGGNSNFSTTNISTTGISQSFSHSSVSH